MEKEQNITSDKKEEKQENYRLDNIKNYIRKSLKNKYVIILILIIIFAFAIRLYYYNFTSGQPLWWDESEYLATAKHWAFNVPYDVNPQRPPLFQFLASLFFSSGLAENSIKFFLIIIPSTFLVYIFYLLGKEMYNKKIGLIAAFLASISWTFIFWSSRVQPDFISICFQVLSILFIWKYWKNQKTKFIIFSAFFAALGFYFKVSALLVPVIIAFFILIKDRFAAFKNKDYYIFAITFLVAFIPYFIYGYMIYHDPLAVFHSGYTSGIVADIPYGWYNINFFYLLTDNMLFILFLAGLLLSLKFILYLDILFKERKNCFDPNIFGILALIIISSFYIFFIRGTEDRWVFLWMPFIFFFIGNSILFIYQYGEKYHKNIGIIIVIIILSFAGYFQLNHTNILIDQKKDSYSQIKDAGLWIKENSDKNDLILSISLPQTVYYSERKTIPYSEFNESYFRQFAIENRPRYILVSLIEPHHPQFIFDWAPQNPDKLIPRQVYFIDFQKTQAVAIVYEINISAFSK